MILSLFLLLAAEPVAAPTEVPAVAPAAEAPEPPRPPRPGIIMPPDWERRPSLDDYRKAYPAKALRLERTGKVVVSCLVQASGELEQCTLVSEDPPGLGFGEASLKLVKRFKMKPKTPDGAPVAGGTVRIVMPWRLPEAE